MADTKKLQDMLNNLISDNSEQAQTDFHDYLGSKMKEVIGVEDPAEVDTNTDKE